jgi:KTSC domain
MTVSYEDVTSSNIRAVGFEKGVGYIWFGSGRRFAYKMDRKLFDAMKAAASIGSFFARMVKKECPVVWNGWGCDASPCRNDATLVGHPGNDPKVGTFRVCDSCAKTQGQLQNITLTPIPDEPAK